MDSKTRDVKKYESRVSRRAFLRAAGSGMFLTSASAAAISFTESTAYARKKWDREADIVVMGSGAAGSSAALFAHESGASVLMLEKAAIYGGTTAKSGGVCWIPNNFLMRDKGLEDPREDCIRYMARTAYPTLYSVDDSRFGLPESTYDLLAAYYDNASPTIDALRTMGVEPFMVWLSYDGTGTAMPDYWSHLPENKAPYGRSIVPARPDGTEGSGALLIAKLKAAVEKRQIPVLLEHRANRLVLNSKGEVIGVEVRTGDDHTVTVRAHKGVIFGSGGFTPNPDLCLNFLRGPIFGGCGVPTCEGDFVYIGAGAGAKLANMNNGWWTQVILERALQSRSDPGGGGPAGDSSILVNRFGRRCVNERAPYNERTQSHFLWDPHTAAYPNLIQFMIYDQSCRERFAPLMRPSRNGGLGVILKPGISVPYVLTGQSLEDLGRLIDARLAQISDKTGNLRLDPGFSANLTETISRFNQFAETGSDLDFHRGETPIELAQFGPRQAENNKPNKTMYPFSATGPYYAVMLGGGTFDTKGGPKINAQAQVVDHDDKPIPGLYGAGNCIAAPAGQAYWAGGTTIGSALIFGALAAKAAVKEPIKELA